MIPRLSSATNRVNEPTRVGPPPQNYLDVENGFMQLWRCHGSRSNEQLSRQIGIHFPLAKGSLGVLLDQFQVESTPLCLREKPAGDGRPSTWLGGTVMPHWGACRLVRASVTRFTTGNVGCAVLCRVQPLSQRRRARETAPSLPYQNCGCRVVLSAYVLRA